MDLIETEDIKKKWYDYTEELYKKDLNDPDNHIGMITHPELVPHQFDLPCLTFSSYNCVLTLS